MRYLAVVMIASLVGCVPYTRPPYYMLKPDQVTSFFNNEMTTHWVPTDPKVDGKPFDFHVYGETPVIALSKEALHRLDPGFSFKESKHYKAEIDGQPHLLTTRFAEVSRGFEPEKVYGSWGGLYDPEMPTRSVTNNDYRFRVYLITLPGDNGLADRSIRVDLNGRVFEFDQLDK